MMIVERAGRWVLGGGCVLFGLGLLAACVPIGPLVIPWQPPREPVTGLDAMEPGETELTGSVGTAVNVPWDGRGSFSTEFFDPQLWAAPWSAGVNHSVGAVELRALVGQHFLGTQVSLGAGLRLPSTAGWDFVVDGGMASSAYQGSFEVPSSYDTGAGQDGSFGNPSLDARDAGDYDYSYRVFAPHARARAIWRASERIQVPLAVRYAYSWTGNSEGLYDWEMRDQEYLELSAGVIWKPSTSCLSVGGGLTMTVTDSLAPMVQVSAGCRFQIKNMVQP